jgi:transcription elongation factor Elf1
MKKIYYEIKSWFKLSCPNCGYNFESDMKDRWDAGYNATCINCGCYIEQEYF